jgi:heat shock protein HslJ
MATGQAGDPLENTSWELVSLGPEGSETLVPADAEVTLVFETGGQSGGKAACNTYGSTYTVDGDAITFEAPISTKMFCEGLMDLETSFLGALEGAVRFEQTGTELKIWYGDGSSVMTYTQAS